MRKYRQSFNTVVALPKLHVAHLPGAPFTVDEVGIPDNMMPQILDQGQWPECAAFSGAESMSVIKFPHYGQMLVFSPGFIYANASTPNQEGMQPQDVANILQNKGVCLMSTWDLDEMYTDTAVPTQAAYNEALNYRIATWGQITTDDEFRSAVSSWSPVMVTIPVYSNFESAINVDVAPMPEGDFLGYHEIVGFRHSLTKGHRIQNSWGSGWGNGGRIWLPPGFPILQMIALTDVTEATYSEVVTFGVNSFFYTVEDIKNEISNTVQMDTTPVLDTKSNHVYVPVRFVAQAFGAQVAWVPEVQHVVITRGTNVIVMVEGQTNYSVNGKSMQMDAPPYIDSHNRTMVPIRFIAEGLGYKVIWNQQALTVTICK